MALEFHFEDTPPQIWLSELQGFHITGLWNPQLRPQQRENLMEQAKRELKNWRLSLRDQMETIKMRYGDENKGELRLMLSPYRTLDDLGTQLNSAIKDLEVKMKDGRALPLGFEIGDYIFGSLNNGRWYFGDAEEMKLYEEFEGIERRYLAVKAEYDEQSGDYKMTLERVREHIADIKTLTREYNTRKGYMQLGLRLAIIFLFSIFSLVLGIVAFTIKPFAGMVMSNEAFGGIMLILGLVGVMIALVLTRRRRSRVEELRQEILVLKRDAKTLTQEAKRLKRHLYPTHQTYKEISARYNEYRAAFH